MGSFRVPSSQDFRIPERHSLVDPLRWYPRGDRLRGRGGCSGAWLEAENSWFRLQRVRMTGTRIMRTAEDEEICVRVGVLIAEGPR